MPPRWRQRSAKRDRSLPNPSADVGRELPAVPLPPVFPAHRQSDASQEKKRAFYHRFAWAYDLIIERPGGPGLDAVAEIFSECGIRQGSFLVDAGCGTGAYSNGLAARGFGVIGVDRSAELVAVAEQRARQRCCDVEFACADFTRGWRPHRIADGALCRGVLNDILGEDARQRAFLAFASWLRPGGALLVDVREREASERRYVGSRTFERTVQRGEDTLTFTSITTMEPGSDLLLLVERWVGTVGGEPVDEESTFRMRCWTSDSLADAARAAGFRRVAPVDPDVVGARGDRLVAVALR